MITLTWQYNAGLNVQDASFTLTDDATLAIVGADFGARGVLKLTQDGTGGRTITLPNNSVVSGGGTSLTLSAAAGAVDTFELYYDGTSYYWSVPDLISGGLGNPAAGSTTQVQFNDAGALAGDAGLTYDKVTNVLTTTGGGFTAATGRFLTADGSAAAPSYSFASDVDTGITRQASNGLDLIAAGASIARVDQTSNEHGFTIRNNSALQWNSDALTGVASIIDLRLVRDAANTLALRNGTNAQGLNIYRSYTDASNYEQGFVSWGNNEFNIGTVSAGTGVHRNTVINAQGVLKIFVANSTHGFSVGTVGILPTNDNLNDLGSASFKFRTGYFGTGTQVGNGSVAAPSFSFASDADTGIYRHSNGGISFVKDGVAKVDIRDEFRLARDIQLGWSSSITDPGAAVPDTILLRDAANTLAQRNGVNAQYYNIYQTYTDASNYRRLTLGELGGSVGIQLTGIGTGSGGDLNIQNNNGGLRFKTAGATTRWYIDTTGHLVGGADNTYDIGASGASRPRNIYAAGTVFISDFLSLNGSYMKYASSGVLTLMDAGATDFNRLQFGGTSSSFPALKRSGTFLQVKLADDSAGAGIQVGDGTAAAPSFSFASEPTTGFARISAGSISTTLSGTVAVHLNSTTYRMSSAMLLGWASSTDAFTTAQDTILLRDAANTLALRNGANAQTFNIYNTYTDASNYKRLSIQANTSETYLTVNGLGTGAGGTTFIIGTSSNNAVDFQVAGIRRWRIADTTGHLLAFADNTYDIGASGANRPKDGYFAGNLSVSVNGKFKVDTCGSFKGSSDGVLLLLDTAETSFNRLQFGGTSASFPAIKRSTTLLQGRLADDTDYCTLQGKIRVHANAVAETPTATHTLRFFDAAGTEYKVLCVAA